MKKIIFKNICIFQDNECFFFFVGIIATIVINIMIIILISIYFIGKQLTNNLIIINQMS